MELIFVRHGQTDLNKNKMYQGIVNSKLNEVGIDDARRVSDKIKDYKIDKIYSSPLIRTLETADIIVNRNHLDLKVIKDERIMEIDFGKWDAMPYDKVMIGFEEEYKGFLRDYKSFTFPEGESFEEFYNRCSEFINEITKKPSDESILIVTHGGVIRVFLMYLLGLNKDMFYSFSVKQGCFTRILVFDGINLIEEVNK